MCEHCVVPLIEFHNLTGETFAIRRDLIAAVMPNAPVGSRVGSLSFGWMEVMETTGEVLALIRGHENEVDFEGVQRDLEELEAADPDVAAAAARLDQVAREIVEGGDSDGR